jgi:predicted nucleic acid-binding protein
VVQQFPIGCKQIYDANIVATMLTYDIPALLTNNTEDFARFTGAITVLPLQTVVA